ncbi:hypothetical protein MTO96_030095, partial [Rhipicephalus appendiculatus]
ELFLPVDVKRVAPFVALTTNESSEVRLAGLDLKCEENDGSGIIICFVNRSEQITDDIPEHIKHRIIEEHELPKVFPLVSDIRDQCSKMPELTGGKGSSLAVLDSIATELKTLDSASRRQYGQPLDMPMAVVVQQLVDATAAGVMFTCDPLTGSPSFNTVTANFGIGESVVSASADPDTFVLKKTGAKMATIESRQIENGEVATVPLSPEKAQSVCMNDKDIEELAVIGMQIEKTYTIPQDIEWAFSDGKFFMLQSRPVTTFLRETDSELIHEFDNGLKSAKEILTKGNMSEVLPGAMPPLTSSFLRAAFDIYCRDDAMRFSHAFNPDPTQYVPAFMPMHRYTFFLWLSDGTHKTGSDASLMDRAFLHSILGRDTSDDVKDAVKRDRKLDMWKLPVQLYYLAEAMLTITHGVEETSRKTANLRLSVDGMTTATQVYDYIGRNLHHLRKPGIFLMKKSMASSFYNAVILKILGAAKRGLTSEVFSEMSQILHGVEVESADVPRMIQELGRVLRESPEREKFLSMTTDEASEWLLKSENECGRKFREFMEKHGHRSVKEFDLCTKPWSLDPSSLVKSLKAAARAGQVDSETSAASRSLSSSPPSISILRRIMLKLVTPKAQSGVAAREAAKSASVRVIHQLRLVCHQLALLMVREGRLPLPELLFFLTFEEVGILLRTRNPELVLKAQRRQKNSRTA